MNIFALAIRIANAVWWASLMPDNSQTSRSSFPCRIGLGIVYWSAWIVTGLLVFISIGLRLLIIILGKK